MGEMDLYHDNRCNFKQGIGVSIETCRLHVNNHGQEATKAPCNDRIVF